MWTLLLLLISQYVLFLVCAKTTVQSPDEDSAFECYNRVPDLPTCLQEDAFKLIDYLRFDRPDRYQVKTMTMDEQAEGDDIIIPPYDITLPGNSCKINLKFNLPERPKGYWSDQITMLQVGLEARIIAHTCAWHLVNAKSVGRGGKRRSGLEGTIGIKLVSIEVDAEYDDQSSFRVVNETNVDVS